MEMQPIMQNHPMQDCSRTHQMLLQACLPLQTAITVQAQQLQIPRWLRKVYPKVLSDHD